MLDNVSLIIGIIVGSITIGAGLVSIGVRMGNTVTKKDCKLEMEKFDSVREDCKRVHDHAQKNATMALQGIPSVYVNKTELQKHESENKESFSKIENHLEDIVSKLDFILQAMPVIKTEIEYLKEKTK